MNPKICFSLALMLGAAACGGTPATAPASSSDLTSREASSSGAQSNAGGSSAVSATSDAGSGGSSEGNSAPDAPCTVHVPDDYEGLGEAVSALLSSGGKICVTAPPKTGTLGDVTAVPANTPPLEIVGYGRDMPANELRIRVVGYTPGLRIRNISLAGLVVRGSIVDLASSKVSGILLDDGPSGGARMTIDACDLSNGETTTNGTVDGAIVIYPYGHIVGELLHLTNSYIHDSNFGIFYYEPTQTGYPIDASKVFLANNTFAHDLIGLELELRDPTQGYSITYANNIFLSNSIAGARVNTKTSPARVTAANNAFDGNAANFYGPLPPGPGFLSADLGLDLAMSPPRPLAGSPCVGASDPMFATTTDYFAMPRTPTADLGAVQH